MAKKPLPATEPEASMRYAEEATKDVARVIRQMLKAEDLEDARLFCRIALNESKEITASLESTMFALPPSPVWVVAAKLQEIRDKGWDQGVVAFDAETYADPTYYDGGAPVPEGWASVPVAKKEPGAVGYPPSTREFKLELAEIEVRREAEKVRRESKSVEAVAV